MDLFKEHKNGLTGTIIFHGIVLVLLLFLGLAAVFPPPGEQGVLVNFGDSENGLGMVEPAPAPNKNPEPVRKEEKKEEVVPPPRPSVPKTQTQPAKEAAMTQDFEESAALKEAERKKQEKLNEEKRIRDEQERQRLAELEKERKAELERIAREDAERKKAAEEKRKIDEINARTKDAFGKSGTGPGGEGTGANPNQGVTFPGGNQGVPTGDPNSGNYGPGGRGSGTQGSGISYSLAGRSALSMPKPDNPKDNIEGIVVVQVFVKKDGTVIKTNAGAKGTTLADPQYWTLSEQAAMKAKFNVSADAPSIQQGTITYKFNLN